MLLQSVGIQSPSSVGGGQYSLNLYFEDTSKAKFVNIDDVLTDTGLNTYKVVSFTAPFSNGGLMTVEATGTDILPVQDTGFDSSFQTPNQVNLRPIMQTSGNITAPTIYNATNYEYQLSGGWASSENANLAVIGDRVVDSVGREFQISYLGPTRFAEPFRVVEAEKIGEAPTAGQATLYRPTGNFNFFQGTELTDPARTNIYNRDKVLIDLSLGQGGSVEPAKTYTNNTGTLMSAGRIVRKGSTATSMQYADWTDEDTTKALGILLADTADGVSGNVKGFGLIESGVITSEDFIEAALPSDNSRVYLGSVDGKLTITPPTPGDAFTVFLGIWDNGQLDLAIDNLGT